MAMNERDITLVTQAKEGDSKAFEELYAQYYNKIFALARVTVKNEADAEDILQQAFINAWKSISDLNNPAGFNTWLQKITLNLSYNLLRKKNLSILMDIESDSDDFIEEPSDEILPAVYAERDDLRIRLGKIIDGLSEVQKQTIILYYFNEQKVEEISYIMDCSTGTVKKRLFLARKAIRTEIEEEEEKSGEKFYGIAGLPMLPLGNLLNSHFESQLLTAEAYAKSLTAISEAISQVAIDTLATTGVSAASSGIGGTATAITKTIGLSAGVKGTIITSVAVVIIGLTVGGVLLAHHSPTNDDTALHDPDDSMTVQTGVPTPSPSPTPTPTPTPEPTPEPEPEPEAITEADIAGTWIGEPESGNPEIQMLVSQGARYVELIEIDGVNFVVYELLMGT